MSPPPTYREFWETGKGELVRLFKGVCFIAVFLAAAMSLPSFAAQVEDRNQEADQRANLVSTLLSTPKFTRHETAATRQQRQKLLSKIRTLTSNGAAATYYLSASEYHQLERDTGGNPVHLSTSHLKWSHYWGVWLPLGAGVVVIYLLNMFLFMYFLECRQESKRPANLPWRKPWPWMLVLATSLPIGWLVWPTSYIRLRLDRSESTQVPA